MQTIKRTRASNWSLQEKRLLRMLVLEWADIIESKVTNSKTNSAKKTAWEEVLSRFNAENATKRDMLQLHTQWRNMKNRTKKSQFALRRARNLTGGGPRQSSPPTEDRKLNEAIPHFNSFYKQKSNKCCDETHEHQLFVLTKRAREEGMLCDKEMHDLKMKIEREMFERRLRVISLEEEYWTQKIKKEKPY